MRKLERKTYIFDAKKYRLGRLASEVARLLIGKNKSNYQPNIDCGDNVIIFNAEKIQLSGKKMKQKKYYRHSGHLGNLKVITFERLFEKDPIKVLRLAMMGMLPKNKLRSKMIKKLTIYKGEIPKNIKH